MLLSECDVFKCKVLKDQVYSMNYIKASTKRKVLAIFYSAYEHVNEDVQEILQIAQKL